MRKFCWHITSFKDYLTNEAAIYYPTFFLAGGLPLTCGLALGVYAGLSVMLPSLDFDTLPSLDLDFRRLESYKSIISLQISKN